MLEEFAQQLVQRLNVTSGISVVLVNDAAMKEYNLYFRGKNRTTDVLSFPYEREQWERGEAYLGDVVISVEQAYRQKKGSLLDELKVLTVHGVLHLLGYDHETDSGEMEQLEKALKREFRLT